MKWARVQITKKVFEDCLPFPEGTRLIRINPPDYRYINSDVVEVVVEHEDFEDVEEGNMMPERIVETKLVDGNHLESEWV